MSEDITPAAPARLADLKPKMKLEGTIKKIELFGAFVDVGVGRDGLLHISALTREGRVNRVEDVVKEGETVTVWVRKVDSRAGRIDLTMIEPLGLEWNEIKKGQVVKGKVVRLERFGAFVDIGAARPALVPVRDLAAGYVAEPRDVVKVGDEVEAVVTSVDLKKRQINLSVKALETMQMSDEDEEEDEAIPTAMEVALRQAMAGRGSSGRAGGQSRTASRPRRRREQDDLLARTLRTQTRDPHKN
ncbi:MAG: S1 RNA-binding domain-containing protein [Chloroflexi bacterium]|nr:S1 RNA-binding domain-containing protein [Chloroflexota bacterium]